MRLCELCCCYVSPRSDVEDISQYICYRMEGYCCFPRLDDQLFVIANISRLP